MKKILCISLVALLCGGVMAQNTKSTKATSNVSGVVKNLTGSSAQKLQVQWTTIENASQLKDNTKLYFVDFYTNWCGWCKRMDKNVFSDTTIAKLMNRFYVPVKFNAEGSSEFTWKGVHYAGTPVPPGARPSLHGFTRAMLGKQLGFPSFVVFDRDRGVITVLQGYQPVEDLKIILWYFASGDYKKYSYEKYQSIFNKEIRPVMEAALR